jgi:tRNA (guanine10-N2)-methyltransferase
MVAAFGASLSVPDQVARIERFAFLPYQGKIDLKKPDVIFTLFEDYKDYPAHGMPQLESPEKLYFGVFVSSFSIAL